jgi:sirohydrochlorin cobaltochelatase
MHCPDWKSSPETGLLVVGHGTRDRAGLDEFQHVVNQLAGRFPRRIVEGCFLELAEPSIAQGFARMVERGARRVVILPLLLFSAGHAQRDVPESVAKAASPFPDIEVHQAPVLGCQRRMIELSTERFGQATRTLVPCPASDTLLLMVGRGSPDPTANSEMVRFARLRWERTQVGWLETCFLAMTEPRLVRALEIVASLPFRRIVVQPHLLFQGQLLDELQRAAEDVRLKAPSKEWIVVEHLGKEGLLVDALVSALIEVAGLDKARTSEASTHALHPTQPALSGGAAS